MIDITVTLATRGRNNTTLPLCLLSLSNQTLLPKKVILVDDNENKDFYETEILRNILTIFKIKNIEFEYYYGPSKGVLYAQQIALDHVDTEWVFRTDDDNVLEPNVLELLSQNITDKTGAVSGLIFSKKDFKINREIEFEDTIHNRIEDVYSRFNIQMCRNQDDTIKKVEHIYSNYLFRRKLIDKYPIEFSPAGHREDTVITYMMFRQGYDLLINPKAFIWHLDERMGGNRTHNSKDNLKNEKLFLEKLTSWGIELNTSEDDKGFYVNTDNQKWLIYEK